MTPIIPEWIDKAGGDVVKRYVVIARYNDRREFDPIEERASVLELTAQGTLGEIAGNGDEIWIYRRDTLDERLEDSLVEAAKVQVRKMNEDAHPIR